jgi:hypothetical protein
MFSAQVLNDRSVLQPMGIIIKNTRPDLVVSKRKYRQAEAVQLVRANREIDRQHPHLAVVPDELIF